jgi:hypothetical protein
VAMLFLYLALKKREMRRSLGESLFAGNYGRESQAVTFNIVVS